MKLVSIYIQEHAYIFSQAQTINLGGKFEYEYHELKNKVIVNRKVNENYIEGLFDLTKLDSSLNLVSAIVGKNGTGKSTILDVIRSAFIRNGYGLPYSKAVLIAEDKNGKAFLLDSDFEEVIIENVFEESQESNKKEDLEKIDLTLKNKVQTIFYSPHFDFKHNVNFDEIDSYDISFDNTLEKDLDDLEHKGPNGSGWNYSPTQELIFKNSLRQLMFLSSDLVRDTKIFKSLFDLPEHSGGRLFFREHKIGEVWNIPRAFRTPLEEIDKKLNEEKKAWTEIRKFDANYKKVLNQVEINQYLAKRKILSDLWSVIKRQMEKSNMYLEEGVLDLERFREKTQDLDALESSFYFFENSKLKIKGGAFNAFHHESIQDLINNLYYEIDLITDEDLISQNFIKIAADKIEGILKLQKNFLLHLYDYYPRKKEKGEESLFDSSNYIEGFINYLPTDRSLSSGENALLNFFSRIYSFIQSNLVKESQYFPNKDHYILLLDEADLAFHPTWKKKYVRALCSTMAYFFNGLSEKPSIQIIFTTHDPLTLSDIPKSNIVFLDRDEEGNTQVIDRAGKRSFGANVHDLLADSFFLEDGFMGEFSESLIHDLIIFLTNADGNERHSKLSIKWDKRIAQIFINMVDEPLISERLQILFDKKFLKNDERSIRARIKELETQLNRLTDAQNSGNR